MKNPSLHFEIMKILIIDGHKEFGVAKGQLNKTLVDYAEKSLKEKGHEVKVTVIDSEYDPKAEVEKLVWADVLLWQFPIWWFGTPWHVKKYLDEVFFFAHGILWSGDGRTRKDPSKKYGDGGLAQGKKFMLSFTWNAPIESLTDPNQFFKGQGADSVHGPIIKSHEFCGMTQIPSFQINDVVKNTDFPAFIKNYEAHLTKYFGKQ